MLKDVHPCFASFVEIPMSDTESSETHICEFLSGFPPEETDICEFLSGFPLEGLDDELLSYATKKYCKPNKPRKAVTTKYDNPARRFELERRLRSLKMEEDEAFDHFYHGEFQNLRDELTDTGRQLDDESLVYLILNALPPSWSSFVDRVVAQGLYGNLLLDIESEEENRSQQQRQQRQQELHQKQRQQLLYRQRQQQLQQLQQLQQQQLPWQRQ